MESPPELPEDAAELAEIADSGAEPVAGARRGKRIRAARRKWLTISSVLSGVGRTMVTSGLLILLFVAYQLWGTGLYTAGQQDHLRSAFDQARAETIASSTTTTTTTTTTTSASAAPSAPTNPPLRDVVPPPDPPAEGKPLAQIRIPKIEVNWTVVEGTSVSNLRKGPGHYGDSPMPGQIGNAVIAGHRTTYGAPFNRLDELKIGDEIRIETLWGGNYVYRITSLNEAQGYVHDFFGAVTPSRDADATGIFPVSPSSIDVKGWYKKAPGAATDPYLPTLTLSTCHPEYTARQRLIATAVLSTEESDAPVAAPSEKRQQAQERSSNRSVTLDQATSSNTFDSERGQAILWGSLTFALGMLWWFVFHRRKKWYVWIVGVLPFLALLFMCYVHIERMLPSSI